MKEPEVPRVEPAVGASLSEPPAVAGGLTHRISTSLETEPSDINIQPSATADGSALHLSEPPAVAGGLTQPIISSSETAPSDINIQPSATADGSDLHLSEPPEVAGGLTHRISSSLDTEPSDINIQPSATADGSDLPFEPIPLEQVFRRSVYDLERSESAYGREIYVQEWEENSARPLIWYEFTGQHVLVRYERQPVGIYTSCLGKTHYL
jgi:hypothetical protein